MKRKYLLFSLLLAGSSLYAQEWPAVRPEARPATRWWWLGSAVDATNLTYNLEEYAKAGLGGVEITPFMVFKATIRITFLSSARNG